MAQPKTLQEQIKEKNKELVLLILEQKIVEEKEKYLKEVARLEEEIKKTKKDG